MDVIKRLEIATENLPDLTGLVKEQSGATTEYDAEGGTLIGFGLYKNGEVAVRRTFMSKDASLEGHQHDEHEYLIVYRGKLAVRRGKKAYVMNPGQSIHFPPGTPHACLALKDTWAIGITVPATEGYPDAPR